MGDQTYNIDFSNGASENGRGPPGAQDNGRTNDNYTGTGRSRNTNGVSGAAAPSQQRRNIRNRGGQNSLSNHASEDDADDEHASQKEGLLDSSRVESLDSDDLFDLDSPARVRKSALVHDINIPCSPH